MNLSIVRPSPARLLLTVLLMVTLGWAQLLGVGRGYWCECSAEPMRVAEAACHPSVCHPTAEEFLVETSSLMSGDCAPRCVDVEADWPEARDGSGPPEHPPHQEIREALVTTAVAGGIGVPAPVLAEVPAATWRLRLPPPVVAVRKPVSNPGWPVDTGPLMPVQVARTMVMLV